MKVKIAKVINSCNHCGYCTYAKADKDNYTHFAVCTAIEGEEFLLFSGRESPKRYDLEIPDNCPLEDYTGTRKIEEDE